MDVDPVALQHFKADFRTIENTLNHFVFGVSGFFALSFLPLLSVLHSRVKIGLGCLSHNRFYLTSVWRKHKSSTCGQTHIKYCSARDQTSHILQNNGSHGNTWVDAGYFGNLTVYNHPLVSAQKRRLFEASTSPKVDCKTHVIASITLIAGKISLKFHSDQTWYFLLGILSSGNTRWRYLLEQGTSKHTPIRTTDKRSTSCPCHT